MISRTPWWLGALALFACAGQLCGPSHLAELEAQRGEVQRDVAGAVGKWHPATPGARFAVGDGLRTGPTGSARLALLPEGLALVEANTLLRFVERDPRSGEQRMSVEEGSLRVESGKLELDVHTPRALARLEQGARVRIVASEQALRLDVLVGRVALDQDGVQRSLVAGENLQLAGEPRGGSEAASALPTLDAGDGLQTNAEIAAAADAAVDAAADAETDAVGAGARAPTERAPHASALALPLEPLTLHASTLPIRMRMTSLPSCPVAPTLELDGRPQPRADAAENDASAPLLVVASLGVHRVRVRCQRRVIGASIVRVQRDSARGELPKRAQHVEVEADGRRYTVRYQNVVPVVHVAWSTAQPAASYALFLRRGKRERSVRAQLPRKVFDTAELTEGSYEFWFTSASGQRSAVSVLRIEFDSSARSLSLIEPREGSVADTSTMESGAALLRSQVSANGVPLPLDDKGHFRGTVPVTHPKIVLVRAQHPAVGVHYYLRTLR